MSRGPALRAEMPADEKRKGKAAVDLVGSQVRGHCALPALSSSPVPSRLPVTVADEVRRPAWGESPAHAASCACALCCMTGSHSPRLRAARCCAPWSRMLFRAKLRTVQELMLSLSSSAPWRRPRPRAERGPRRRQVGKSGASWIAQALLLALGSIAAALPIIAAIFAAVIAAWLGAVRHLNAQMEARYTRP